MGSAFGRGAFGALVLGERVRVQVADPDGYRVDVYAHDSRHDVEKRRPAPLTR
jgi:hypothetical protein